MRAVVTGQVGLDKTPFLQRVVELAGQDGFEVTLCNIGEMMYAEAPDVASGRILDLPLSRLNSLRRSVFKDVLRLCETKPNVIVNTHATFRWRHGLFAAFDFDQMSQLNADVYVTLVDNVDAIHSRMIRDGHRDHTLKDLMVWREEETMATELLSELVRGHGQFYILGRGFEDEEVNARTMAQLLFRPQMRKVYLSFPMSHVMDLPDTMAEIESFRREMKRYFVCFDPFDVEEKYLHKPALRAAEQGQKTMDVGPEGAKVSVDVSEVLSILADIDGQIYARDFKLIDQADMICSLVPELEGGRPGLSSGVERELQHAHEGTKEVYVIWHPKVDPSPFVTETATRVFRSTKEALEYFIEHRYVPAEPAGGLFGKDQ